MRNFVLYCKDFEKYGNFQKWSLKIMGEKIKFYTTRNNNRTWSGFMELNEKGKKNIIECINEKAHGGIASFSDNSLGFSFSGFYDYKPKYFELGYYSSHLSKNLINDLKYWTFPEVRDEIEKMAFLYISLTRE
jgi:hypothetical protein